MVIVFATSKFWIEKPVIEWDVTLYYSYLPAIFIYDDLKFENPVEEWEERHLKQKVVGDGHSLIKMTSGLAMLYSPFFFGAHACATLSNQHPADGFSAPYRLALLLSALVFMLLGFWFLAHWLQFFFSEKVATITALLIFCGSNLPYYTLVEPMSHVYNFALISMILYWFFKYLKNQHLGFVVCIGIAAGLLVLIRPTNIMALLFPALFLIHKWKTLNSKKVIQHIAIAIVLAFIVWLPQFTYWKYITGDWLVYSYTDEGFFFTDPKIWKGLFGYRKGWFVYSPILWFALPGFAYLFIKQRKVAAYSIATLLITFWVTFSWWCWWYGGGLGSRPLIEFLPFMALGIAAFLTASAKWKNWIRLPVFASIVFMTLWGGFMNKQYLGNVIHYESMSKELFWKQFLINRFVEDHNKYLDHPDYDKALRNEEWD